MDCSNSNFTINCESNPAFYRKCSVQWMEGWSESSMKKVKADKKPFQGVENAVLYMHTYLNMKLDLCVVIWILHIWSRSVVDPYEGLELAVWLVLTVDLQLKHIVYTIKTEPWHFTLMIKALLYSLVYRSSLNYLFVNSTVYHIRFLSCSSQKQKMVASMSEKKRLMEKAQVCMVYQCSAAILWL